MPSSRGLGLDHGPGGHAADHHVVGGAELPVGAQVPVHDQLAGGDRIAGGVQLVLAQEHLVRGVRGVGLVLVDERRGRVDVLVDVVGRAQDAVGAGQMVARVSTMKLVGLPGTNSGSSGCSGMNTVPLPPLFTRSRPWSKNWPKKVNQELNGADRPTSGGRSG